MEEEIQVPVADEPEVAVEAPVEPVVEAAPEEVAVEPVV